MSRLATASPAAVARPLPFWRRYWDFLAVILLMLGSFPTVWLRHATVTLVPNLGLIDDNWHLDSHLQSAARHLDWPRRRLHPRTHLPVALVDTGAHSAVVRRRPLCHVEHAAHLVRVSSSRIWRCGWSCRSSRRGSALCLLLMLASFWETSLRTAPAGAALRGLSARMVCRAGGAHAQRLRRNCRRDAGSDCISRRG